MTAQSDRRSRPAPVPGLPPWLWITFFLSVFTTLPVSLGWILRIFTGLSWLLAGDVDSGARAFGQGLSTSGAVVIFLGVLTVLFPRARQRWVERSYGLQAGPFTLNSLAEMETYIHQYAPGLVVMAAPLRPFTAFVYPSGYRGGRMAIGAGLLKLWRSDQPAAKAVLQHELAHYFHRDLLIVGTGSLMTSGFKWIFRIAIYAQLIMIGVNLLLVNPALGPAASLAAQAAGLIWFYLSFLLVRVIELVGILTNLILWLLPIILAMWCIEIYADWRAVQQVQGRFDEIQNGLLLIKPAARGRILTDHLTHPPAWLRKWAIRHHAQIGYLFMLVLFPLGYLVYVPIAAFYTGSDLLSLWLQGEPLENINYQVIFTTAKISGYLTHLAIFYAVLLLVWPFMAGFLKNQAERKTPAASRDGPPYPFSLHAAASAIILAVVLVGYIWLQIPFVLFTRSPTLAMALSTGNSLPRTLVFQNSGASVSPWVATSNYTRQFSQTMLKPPPGEFAVLLVFPSPVENPLQIGAAPYPISIALLSDDGKVMNLLDTSGSEPSSVFRPAGKYRFVLLMPPGWFASHGVQPGEQVGVEDWPPPANCPARYWQNSC